MRAINRAAPRLVSANSSLSLNGSVFNENRPPSRPPARAAGTRGSAMSGLKSPAIAWPVNPINAVTATMADEVPTAMRMGTPQKSTMSGILKDPPETPIIPAKKPVAAVMGIAVQRFTV